MQEKSTYTPTSGALSGESFEEQTVNKFKAQKTWQSGNVLPVGIEDQEIWLHTDENGKQLLGVYRYDSSKPTEFGTLILGAFATNEELDKANPTEAELVELEKKIANARQIVELLSNISVVPYQLLEERTFTFDNIIDGFYPLIGTLLTTIPNAEKVIPYLKERPEILKTEAQWQALVVSNGTGGAGGAPFFVLDESAGTLRLPDVRYMFEENLGTARQLRLDGLPNITGQDLGNSSASSGYLGTTSGALYNVADQVHGGLSSGGYAVKKGLIGFNASLSNPIYGRSARVQPLSYTTVKCIYLGV